MIVVGIPTIGLSPRLRPLVLGLLHVPHVEVVLVCNRADAFEAVERIVGSVTRDHPTTRLRVHYRPGIGIYEAWAHILAEARWMHAETCVVLNDDVWIDPVSVLLAAATLQRVTAHPGGRARKVGIVGWDPDAPVMSRPDVAAYQPVSGTYREGGITGFAWAVDPADGFGVDIRFGWWGGDDDLVWTVIECGFDAIKMAGVGVEHDTSTSSTQRPEVLESIDADRELLRSKWGRTF